MFRLRRHCRIDGKANSLLQYPERRVRNKDSPIMNTRKHLSMIVEEPVCTNIPISFLKKKLIHTDITKHIHSRKRFRSQSFGT